MYGRENLETMQLDGWAAYDIKDADPVMDRMENRIKELEAENERLKKMLDFEKSQAEGWRDRAEKLEHENHPEHFDRADHLSHDSEMVTHREELCVARSEHCYNPLKMFYEIAERYFSVSTPQDLENALKEQRETNVIVHKDYIEHIRKENERLNKEIELYEENTEQQGKILEAKSEENEKLKRLSLRLFEMVAKNIASEWAEFCDDSFPHSGIHKCRRRKEQWLRIAKKCGDEYRKMKAALREGK